MEQKNSPSQGRPKARGNRAGAEEERESEGRVRAVKSGNARQADPAEQRRPVLL